MGCYKHSHGSYLLFVGGVWVEFLWRPTSFVLFRSCHPPSISRRWRRREAARAKSKSRPLRPMVKSFCSLRALAAAQLHRDGSFYIRLSRGSISDSGRGNQLHFNPYLLALPSQSKSRDQVDLFCLAASSSTNKKNLAISQPEANLLVDCCSLYNHRVQCSMSFMISPC